MNPGEILNALKECNDLKGFREYLNSRGIKLSDKTEDGETILHIIFRLSLSYQNIALIKSLISTKEIDLNAVNKESLTCFDVLIHFQSLYGVEIATLLLESGLHLNRENDASNAPLHTLIKNSKIFNEQLAQAILTHKPDPSVLSNKGESYLDLLLQHKPYGWHRIAIQLILIGADVERLNADKESYLSFLIETRPLHWDEVVEAILSKRPNINTLNRHGKTCLELLLEHQPLRWDKIAIQLIQMGANVTTSNNENCLMQMLKRFPYHGDKVAQLLIEIEKNIETRNKQGKSYFDLCFESEYMPETIIEAIIRKMAQQNTLTISICTEAILANKIPSYKYQYYLRFFLENGADLHACDRGGKLLISSLFMCDTHDWGTKYRCKDIIQSLIKDHKLDFGRKIGDKTVLERLEIEKIQDENIQGIVIAAALQSNDEVRKELLDICYRNRIGVLPIMTQVLTQNLGSMDPTLLRMEEDFIYNRETQNTRDGRFNFDSKMLGHRFSLNGTVPVSQGGRGEENGLLTLTGFSHLCTAVELCRSLQNFIEEFSAELPPQHLAMYQKIYHVTRKALRCCLLYNDFRLENIRPKALESLLKDCKDDVAMIHSGYYLHAVCITIVKGSMLYRSNKGGCNFGNDVVELYKITKPEALTTQFLETLLKEDSSEQNKLFIHRDMHEILGLELVEVIKGKLQTVGNCSWASKKAGVRALIHYLSAQLISESKEKTENNTIMNQLFKAWTHFDRRFNFKHYVTQYRELPTLPYMLRRILCTHFEALKEKDLALGRQVVEILKTLPNFSEGFVEYLIKHWFLGVKKLPEKQKQFFEFMATLGINLNEISPDFPHIVKLFAATIQNDAKAVDELLRTGIKPEACSYLGWTTLHIAVANGNQALIDLFSTFEPKWAQCRNIVKRTPLFYVTDPKIADHLVSLGCPVNDTVDHDNTPLNAAASQGNLPLVQCLVKHGAKPNHETLHCAARSGCVKTGAFLLKIDPKMIVSKDYDYYLPIHTAAELGHQDFVEFLLEQGSASSEPDVNGNTPLHLAARYEQEVIIQRLADLPTCHLTAKNHQNRTLMAFALHQAEKKWHHEISRAIREREKATRHYDTVFVPDRRMALLKTPEQTLFGAVRIGDIVAVRGCLAKFPKLVINAIPEPFAHDALQEAITQRHHDIFDLLIKIPGINVNSQNGIQETTLHCAVASGNMHALNVLVRHPKININGTDDMGYTALHDAAERGNIDAIKVLLTHKDIDSTSVNKKGKRADEIAKASYFSDISIASLIRDHQESLLKRRAEKSFP